MKPRANMQFLPIKTQILKPNCDLVDEIQKNLKRDNAALKEKDILIISSKVVSLSEGRMVDLANIKPSKRAAKSFATRYGLGKEKPSFIELVIRESDVFIPGKMLMGLKHGALLPGAGVDRSNAPENCAILLPKNPWKSAYSLRKALQKIFRLKRLGVVIADSFCQPLRWGATGLALAWAGFAGIEDCRGKKDIFGKKLQVTKKAIADNLASGSLILMGEGSEKIPFVIARGAPVEFTNLRPQKSEVFMKPSQCVFQDIYKKSLKNNIKAQMALPAACPHFLDI